MGSLFIFNEIAQDLYESSLSTSEASHLQTVGCKIQFVGYATERGDGIVTYVNNGADKMEDKRPKGSIGREKDIVHNNLDLIQKTLNITNPEMAEILGVNPKYYETIKRNGGPLDYEKLNRLFYNLNIDLNRLIANDERANIVRDTDDKEAPVEFKVKLENLLIDISNAESYEKSIELISYTYLRFGEFIKDMFLRKEGVRED